MISVKTYNAGFAETCDTRQGLSWLVDLIATCGLGHCPEKITL